MVQKLILVRGICGSGKSTVAKAIAESISNCRHYETDMYFMNSNGEYKFVGEQIMIAHKWCQTVVNGALINGESVVVSNTFTQIWELEPYLAMAEQFGINPQIITCQGDFGNVHNIGEPILDRMRNRWEHIPVRFLDKPSAQ